MPPPDFVPQELSGPAHQLFGKSPGTAITRETQLMKRKVLASSVAVIALCLALPVLAASGGLVVGDDSATIVQTGEANGQASQSQPGGYGNTATITQSSGSGDQATQQQNRQGFAPVAAVGGGTTWDMAGGGTETIAQTTNTNAVASQEDNTWDSTQTITQTNNAISSATQTINASASYVSQANTQSATQTGNSRSGIAQTIGLNALNTTSTAAQNGQSAAQTNQNGSSIQQVVDGDTALNNKQTAEQTNGSSNAITQQALSNGTGNTQSASIDYGNGNTIGQTQNGGVGNTQTASVTGGNSNNVSQYQGIGGSGNVQTAYVSSSSNGTIQQTQANGVSSGTQTAYQLNTYGANQIYQTQSTSGNVATVTQSFGSGNVAIQKQ